MNIELFEVFLKKRYQKKDIKFIENYFNNYSEGLFKTLEHIVYTQKTISETDMILAQMLMKDAELASDYIIKFFPELLKERKVLIEDLANTKREYVVTNLPEYISLTDSNEKVHYIKKIPHTTMVNDLVMRNDHLMNLICFQADLRDVLRYKYASSKIKKV